MKKTVVLIGLLISFSFGQSIYKTVDDATNSGITEGSAVPEEQRPDGFIIKHVHDIDKDGVKDIVDECLDTPEGKVVNKDGCVKLIRLNVKFDFDKSDIKDEYTSQILEAVQFLRDNQTYKVVVEGHTDAKGTNEYNYGLSQRRAQKVAMALKNEGIANKRIITKSFGETAPIASNKTKEGRAQNRRVDINFNK